MEDTNIRVLGMVKVGLDSGDLFHFPYQVLFDDFHMVVILEKTYHLLQPLIRKGGKVVQVGGGHHKQR